MRLLRNVFLKAPDFRSILATANPQATLYRFKDWSPVVFQATIPIERRAMVDAIDYDITTCHLTGTMTILAKRRREPYEIDDRICSGLGTGEGCELR